MPYYIRAQKGAIILTTTHVEAHELNSDECRKDNGPSAPAGAAEADSLNQLPIPGEAALEAEQEAKAPEQAARHRTESTRSHRLETLNPAA